MKIDTTRRTDIVLICHTVSFINVKRVQQFYFSKLTRTLYGLRKLLQRGFLISPRNIVSTNNIFV